MQGPARAGTRLHLRGERPRGPGRARSGVRPQLRRPRTASRGAGGRGLREPGVFQATSLNGAAGAGPGPPRTERGASCRLEAPRAPHPGAWPSGPGTRWAWATTHEGTGGSRPGRAAQRRSAQGPTRQLWAPVGAWAQASRPIQRLLFRGPRAGDPGNQGTSPDHARLLLPGSEPPRTKQGKRVPGCGPSGLGQRPPARPPTHRDHSEPRCHFFNI